MNLKSLKYQIVSFWATTLFFLLINSKTYSQEKQVKFREIQGTDDISLGKINAITQDKNGFIWLSAQNNQSIIRFDGTNMEQITANPDNPDDPKSLGGFYPECFFAEDNGILWIGFYGQGLDRYDLNAKTFVHYDHDPGDPKSLASDYVTGILRDHFGNLWVATYGGLDLMNEHTGAFTHHKYIKDDPTSLTGDSIRQMYEDKSGTLWIGTGLAWDSGSRGGLNKYNHDKNNFTQYIHDPQDPNSLINNYVRAIFEDSRGTFWVGTGGDGLHTMNRETGKFIRHIYDPKNPNKLSRPPVADPASDRITFIREDNTGKIWIGTDQNGINVYDPDKETITHYGEEVDNGVWWMYISSDNQIWITTNQNRLLKVTHDYTPAPAYYGQLRRKYIQSDSVRWFGNENGLIREVHKGSNSTMKYYPVSPDNSARINQNRDSISEEPIDFNFVFPIVENTEKKILFRRNIESKINLLDPITGNVTAFEREDTLNLSNFDVSQIYMEQDSVYWIGSWNFGLLKVDQKNNTSQRFMNDPTNGRSLCSNTIFYIQSDNGGNIWLGTANGIQRYNPETNDFSSFILGSITFQLLTDSKGIIWAVTSNGVHYFDPSTKKFNSKQINGYVHSVFEDIKDSSLWFSSTSGIYKLNASRQYTTFFEKEEKNEAPPANNGYWTINEGYRVNNKIYLGSGTGQNVGMYYVFDPDKLIEQETGSIPYVAALRLNEKLIEPGPDSPVKLAIEVVNTLKLANNQNIFSLNLAAIDLQNRYGKEIYYMLEGYDLEWKKTLSNEWISYFKIPAGKYTFKLKTPNPNGTWNEKKMEVIIAPPFYLTWWSFIVYFLLFCVGVYSVHRIQKTRVLRKVREQMKDKELAQAKEIEKAYEQLKSTQSQLIQSEKMASLGELTAGIAHEIQNPLNFVNNFSEINKELIDELKEELAIGNRQSAEEIANDIKENEEKINHHGKRADAIVKGMLQHSRTSNGVKEPTDINALADEYLRLAYHGLRAKDKSFNADFKTDFDPNLPKINVIPQDIGRVLLNLINNAFYAVDKRAKENDEEYKPLVVVKTQLEGSPLGGPGGQEVHISVSDNGPGIPPEIIDKIFQPFFTTKPTGQGTGLGLSLSYDIVKAHGGELKVETTDGEGTSFIVIIPNN